MKWLHVLNVAGCFGETEECKHFCSWRGLVSDGKTNLVVNAVKEKQKAA